MQKVGLRKEVGGVGNRIHMAQKKKEVKGHKRRGGGMRVRSRERRQNKVCVKNAIP